MIFGFNTDIKHADTVYHVQSEARENERLLQTQVFVRGHCIGKRATSYADKAAESDFTDQRKEHMLRDQHRRLVDRGTDGSEYRIERLRPACRCSDQKHTRRRE